MFLYTADSMRKFCHHIAHVFLQPRNTYKTVTCYHCAALQHCNVIIRWELANSCTREAIGSDWWQTTWFLWTCKPFSVSSPSTTMARTTSYAHIHTDNEHIGKWNAKLRHRPNAYRYISLHCGWCAHTLRRLHSTTWTAKKTTKNVKWRKQKKSSSSSSSSVQTIDALCSDNLLVSLRTLCERTYTM